MSNPPIYEINTKEFIINPYPDLKNMRKNCPICYVPQLGATLFTKRNSIAENEKKIDIFSSVQPGGLMTTLMGENMMRKDGESHQLERKAIYHLFLLRLLKISGKRISLKIQKKFYVK